MREGRVDGAKSRYGQKALGEAAQRGMSIREFCRRRRLKESQFYWWQPRLRLGQPEGIGSRSGVNGEGARFALVSEEGASPRLPEDAPSSVGALSDGSRTRFD